MNRRLHGIHHVTAITAEAQPNVDFYADVLGLRLVKKTVNFDSPDMYHLYFGDEVGHAGSTMTFFEIPGAAPGRPGAGMVHETQWRVRDTAALDFWTARLTDAAIATERDGATLRFADPEGLGLAFVADQSPDAPLAALHPAIPAEHALLGFAGARAYSSDPERSTATLERLPGFERSDDGAWRVEGDRSSTWHYDSAPVTPGRPGAGTVHHIAWAAKDAEQEDWQAAIAAQGLRPSPIMDRTYFRSVYFREPSGVLFEIATDAPGFTLDEPVASLGSALRLPPQFEARRVPIEARLRPLRSPRDVASHA
ncbi:MAG: glyoxalase family protein [Gaiellaceae bacterium]|nr:glyoxalase family protein [Gaiellaceae bacterium]